MNRYKPDAPNRFYPAKYSPAWAGLLSLGAEAILRPMFRVRSVRVEGQQHLLDLNRAGHPCLVAANHADHADPAVMVTTGRRIGLPFHFMAARDCFQDGRVNAFIMQRMGCFSVDREGADLAAIKAAMGILRDGRFPLVIFPEGEIYHHHEALDELNEGVAAIALRVADGQPGNRRVHLVPASLRYTCDDAVAESFARRIERLEQRIWWTPRPDLSVVERIVRLGRGLVAVKEEEFLGHAQPGDLGERLRGLQLHLIGQVEARLHLDNGKQRLPYRVKIARQRIRQLLNADPAPPEAERKALYADIDRLFLVVQAYSYPLPYMTATPSVHRIAETLFKIEEDVFGAGEHPEPRDATVRFGAPVDVAAFVAARGMTFKAAAAPLIADLHGAIQGLLRL